MTDLLQDAIAAHGGLDQWNRFTTVEAHVSITGAIWYVKSKPNFFESVDFAASTHEQRVTLSPVGIAGGSTYFADDVLTARDADLAIVEERNHPEASFEGQSLTSPWDDLHAAYFATEAIWTYLTVPFLFTYPGFTTREVDPRQVDGETWRCLEVTFPEYIHSHTKVQKFYFGPDGLLRRHDYTVDILGGGTGANYATDIQDIDGIQVPMRRRIWAYDESEEVIPEPLLVAVDILSLKFA